MPFLIAYEELWHTFQLEKIALTNKREEREKSESLLNSLKKALPFLNDGPNYLRDGDTTLFFSQNIINYDKFFASATECKLRQPTFSLFFNIILSERVRINRFTCTEIFAKSARFRGNLQIGLWQPSASIIGVQGVAHIGELWLIRPTTVVVTGDMVVLNIRSLLPLTLTIFNPHDARVTLGTVSKLVQVNYTNKLPEYGINFLPIALNKD
jgi:hypothetical protein